MFRSIERSQDELNFFENCFYLLGKGKLNHEIALGYFERATLNNDWQQAVRISQIMVEERNYCRLETPLDNNQKAEWERKDLDALSHVTKSVPVNGVR